MRGFKNRKLKSRRRSKNEFRIRRRRRSKNSKFKRGKSWRWDFIWRVYEGFEFWTTLLDCIVCKRLSNTYNYTKNLFEHQMQCMKIEYRSYIESYRTEFSRGAFGKCLPPSETDQKVAMTVCSDLLIVPVISVTPPQMITWKLMQIMRFQLSRQVQSRYPVQAGKGR